VAFTHPSTRRSLRRRELLAALPALGAVLLLLVALWSARLQSRSTQLQRHGVQAPAIVTAVDARVVGRSRQPDGSVTVRFDADGDARSATIDVGVAVAGFQVGQQTTVVYDADDHSHVEVSGLGSADGGVPVWAPLAGAIVLGLMAGIAGRRAWRIGRVVRSAPWRPVPARLIEVPYTVGIRQRARLVLVLDAPSGPMMVAPSGLGRLDPSFVPETWLAGAGGKRQVIATPGGGHVLAVDVITPPGTPPTSRP
jgi:hypothetical protein